MLRQAQTHLLSSVFGKHVHKMNDLTSLDDTRLLINLSLANSAPCAGQKDRNVVHWQSQK